MNIEHLIRAAASQNWQYTDDFKFFYSNAKYALGVPGATTDTGTFIEIATVNVALPQLSAGIEQAYHGGEWRITTQKFNPFSLSATFKDVQGMGLRGYFTRIWADQQDEYFNSIKSTLQVLSKGNLILATDTALISDVSQATFDQGNTQIIEFSVSFTFTSFSTPSLQNFGKSTGTSQGGGGFGDIFGGGGNFLGNLPGGGGGGGGGFSF